MNRIIAVTAASLVLAILASTPAFAKTIQEYEAMPSADQSEYMISYLEKMTYDLGQKNPKLAQDIKNYFVRKQPGKPYSEGLENVSAAIAALDNLAKQGKADLSKIQVESVVLYVVKQKFPPPATAQK